MKHGTVTIDTTEFQAALRDYMKVSKKSLRDVVNTKAYFICRGATRTTGRANPGKIETELGKDVEAWREIKRGKNAGKLKRVGYSIKSTSLANNILRERLWRKGEKQPTKAQFRPVIKRFIKARASASAFIASGWIQAVKFFAAIVRDTRGAPSVDKSVKLRTKRLIGGGNAATEVWNPTAKFWNSAVSKRGTNGQNALTKMAGEGLRQAIANETKSMREYIAKKLQGDANKHNTTKF